MSSDSTSAAAGSLRSSARLEGKVALITGAGRGLGAAIARRFVEAGAEVLVNEIDPATAQAIGRELDVRTYVADVSDSAAVDRMLEQIDRDVGRLDVLVNNAGISGLEGEPERARERQLRAVEQAEQIANGDRVTTHLDATVELEDEEWRRMIAVHLDGTFFCTRAALRLMNQQGSGVILNMGSIMGTAAGAGSPHYCAAKAGILGLTRSLARELVTRGIRVNAIAPGWIESEMTAPLEILQPLLIAQTPMRRFGEPDDIAWAAVYLASEEAKFVTGQVLSPNGGWYMSQ